MFSRTLFIVLSLLGSTAASSKPHRLDSRQTSASKIQLTLQENLCVTVMGGQAVAGAAVQISNCFEDSDQFAPMQKFTCEGEEQANENGEKSLSIKLESCPNLCIDRGCDESDDGSGLQLQECDQSNPSQSWTHSQDQIFSMFGDKKQCLDSQAESGHYQVEGEPYPSEKFLQTWTCFENNDNQKWKLTPA